MVTPIDLPRRRSSATRRLGPPEARGAAQPPRVPLRQSSESTRADSVATSGPRRCPIVEKALVLQGQARPEGSGFAGKGHPGGRRACGRGRSPGRSRCRHADSPSSPRRRGCDGPGEARRLCVARWDARIPSRCAGAMDRVFLRRRRTFRARPAPCLRCLVATLRTAARLEPRVSPGCERCAPARGEHHGRCWLRATHRPQHQSHEDACSARSSADRTHSHRAVSSTGSAGGAPGDELTCEIPYGSFCPERRRSPP